MPRTLSGQESVAAKDDGDVVMPSWEAAALEVVQAQLALEVLVGAFGAPALLEDPDDLLSTHASWQRGEREFRRLLFTVEPLGNEPERLSVRDGDPVVVDDLILISGAYYKIGSVLLRVKKDGKAVEEVWRSTALELHWMTPIYHDGYLYWVSEKDGIAYSIDAKTGKEVYGERLSPRPDRIYASPVAADGKIYYVSRSNGT